MNRLRLIGCSVVFLSACRGSVQPTHTPDVDPARLAGAWHLELRNGSLLPFDRIPVVGAEAPFLSGELHLVSIDSLTTMDAPRTAVFRGKLVATLLHAENAPRVEFGADALLEGTGKTTVTLTFPGPCPCVTLAMVGVLSDRGVRGHFAQTQGQHTVVATSHCDA